MEKLVESSLELENQTAERVPYQASREESEQQDELDMVDTLIAEAEASEELKKTGATTDQSGEAEESKFSRRLGYLSVDLCVSVPSRSVTN